MVFSKRIHYQNINDIRVLMLAKTHNGLKQNTIYSIPPDSVLKGFTIKQVCIAYVQQNLRNLINLCILIYYIFLFIFLIKCQKCIHLVTSHSSFSNFSNLCYISNEKSENDHIFKCIVLNCIIYNSVLAHISFCFNKENKLFLN